MTLHIKEDAADDADSICICNLPKYYSEFVNHPIHLRTRNITKVDIPDDDDVDLKVEDRDDKKKEEDDNMEVLDKDVDGAIDEDIEDRHKDTKKVMIHSWEEVNYEQTLCAR